jgi:hypothetical protein
VAARGYRAGLLGSLGVWLSGELGSGSGELWHDCFQVKIVVFQNVPQATAEGEEKFTRNDGLNLFCF